MARQRPTRPVRSHETRGLLLRRVEYSESDLVVTFFGESTGRVSALARRARKSRRRFAGTLEPMHTLRVRMDERIGAELFTLKEATIDSPRNHLVADLARLEAAGHALGWIRRAAPPGEPDAEVWAAVTSLLDRLDDRLDDRSARLHLAEAGLRLLVAFGWGLDVGRCVRCGKRCEPSRSAMVDAARGGLVCRSCGGARRLVDGETRRRLALASTGASPALIEADAERALDLVDQALRAHAGFD